MADKKDKQETGRSVVRKGDQIIATLLDSSDREDFEERFRTKCVEAGMKIPPLVPFGSGEQVAIACKSRDQAIFVIDFAEEAVAEMPAGE